MIRAGVFTKKTRKIISLAAGIPLGLLALALIFFQIVVPLASRYLLDHVDTKYKSMRSMLDMTPQALDIMMESIKDIRIPGRETKIPARVYAPKKMSENPVVVMYMHGGGFVLGSPAVCDRICRGIANTAGCVVLSLSYRLAPEYPYPAALNDCRDSLLWLFDHAVDYGASASRVVVAGESAGANLAAILSLMGRDKKFPGPAAQILISPPVGSINPATGEIFDSVNECTDDAMLTTKSVVLFADMYLGDPHEYEGDPYVYPLYAKSHKGLAPAMIITCQTDPLRDEGLAYVRALESDGVRVVHRHFMDKPHGYSGQEVIELAGEFLSSL